ncbi:MAG: hypothetical protein KAH22_04500, partial [Thiotrichaceae bacterium]|nr:hypothetical protein [Thiotrichaceae bacterium]
MSNNKKPQRCGLEHLNDSDTNKQNNHINEQSIPFNFDSTPKLSIVSVISQVANKIKAREILGKKKFLLKPLAAAILMLLLQPSYAQTTIELVKDISTTGMECYQPEPIDPL